MRAPSDITCASPVPSRVEHRAGKKRKNKWKKGREGKVSKEEGKKNGSREESHKIPI